MTTTDDEIIREAELSYQNERGYLGAFGLLIIKEALRIQRERLTAAHDLEKKELAMLLQKDAVNYVFKTHQCVGARCSQEARVVVDEKDGKFKLISLCLDCYAKFSGDYIPAGDKGEERHNQIDSSRAVSDSVQPSDGVLHMNAEGSSKLPVSQSSHTESAPVLLDIQDDSPPKASVPDGVTRNDGGKDRTTYSITLPKRDAQLRELCYALLDLDEKDGRKFTKEELVQSCVDAGYFEKRDDA